MQESGKTPKWVSRGVSQCFERGSTGQFVLLGLVATLYTVEGQWLVLGVVLWEADHPFSL